MQIQRRFNDGFAAQGVTRWGELRQIATTNGKQGVAEIPDFVVNCIVIKGKPYFGYTLGYNFKIWHIERSKDRIISP